MTPIQNQHCNAILKRPEGMSEEQCGDLHILRDRGGENVPASVSSFWKPTDDEIQDLIDGGTIMLTVQGHTHPPLSLNAIRP